MKYMFKILVKETKLVVRLFLLIDKDFKIYFNVSPKGRGLFSMLSLLLIVVVVAKANVIKQTKKL